MERINAYADEVLEPDQLRPRLRIDGPLSLKGITHDLVRGLDLMGPFGLSNPRPVFHATPVEIVDGPRALKERHLKMTFCQDGRRFRAIAWRGAERLTQLQESRAGIDLAFSVTQSTWGGDTAIELEVADEFIARDRSEDVGAFVAWARERARHHGGEPPG